jgi:hypothetical protein
MPVCTIQTGGPGCCRDLALPVGLLRKTDPEWTGRNTLTADERRFTQIRGKPRMDTNGHEGMEGLTTERD